MADRLFVPLWATRCPSRLASCSDRDFGQDGNTRSDQSNRPVNRSTTLNFLSLDRLIWTSAEVPVGARFPHAVLVISNPTNPVRSFAYSGAL